MPIRVSPFVTGEYYHIFNRGVDRSAIFKNSTDYHHFISAFDFYRFQKTRVKYSHYCKMIPSVASAIRDEQEKSGVLVRVFAFALMPNHFHLLLRQEVEHGIHTYLFKALNSYAKYFNTKRKRVGPVFQGNFQAVRIESDAQLLHVSRYIHLNPVVSGITTIESIHTYPWTSFPGYINNTSDWVDTTEIVGLIGSVIKYESFVADQVEYAKTLSDIRHVALDAEDAFV